jgi:hypothetical protein
MVIQKNRLPLKDILAAIDMKAKNIWDEFSADEQKQIGFYILNRYASSVVGKKEDKELTILKTNEYYNKNFFTLSKHKKLLWYLLCMTASDRKKITFHPWIGYKHKEYGSKTKAVKFLKNLYPTKKEDEIQLLATINSVSVLKTLAQDFGMSKEEIKKVL